MRCPPRPALELLLHDQKIIRVQKLKHRAAHDFLLGPAEKRELLQLMDDFRRRFVPLAVPLTLVRHYVTSFQIAYLRDQTYLATHPRELMLQVHV